MVLLIRALKEDLRGVLVTQFVLLSFIVAIVVFSVAFIGIAYWVRADLDKAAYSAVRYMATQNRATWPLAKQNALRAIEDDLAMNPFLRDRAVREGCDWRSRAVTACFEARWWSCEAKVTLRLSGWRVAIPFLWERDIRIGAGHVASIEYCP